MLVCTQPHAKLLNGFGVSHAMQLRQTPEGRLLAAIHFEDARADAVERKVAADAFETPPTGQPFL
jgi:hypothetical protein